MRNRYNYRLYYRVPDDPSSYPVPNFQPVHIWSSKRKDVVALRKKFVVDWIFNSALLWVLIFILCVLYFGAGHNPSRYTNNLDVNIVDFDEGLAAYYFLNAFRQTPPGNQTLDWLYKSSSDYNGDVSSTQYDVEHGKVWATVVLQPGTTLLISETLSAFLNTTMLLTSPFASSPPIIVMYEEGRNTFTINNYVLPPIRQAIATATAQYAQRLRNDLIINLTSSPNFSNNRSLQLMNVLQLGPLLADPLTAKYINLHPVYPYVGQLATTLGYIYLYLISGLVVGGTIRAVSPFVGKVHWLDLIVYRIFNGYFQSFIVSLIYSLIVLWFYGIHSGSEFMRYWMFNWLSVIVFGTIVVIFTVNLGILATFFLTIFVALMLSGATIQISLQLSQRFFRYDYGLPLYHIINGGRHILLHSYSNFGLDIGVLIAWFVGLFVVTAATSIYWMKRQEKKLQHKTEQNKTKKKNVYSVTTTVSSR